MMRDTPAANAGRLPLAFNTDWLERPVVRVLVLVALGIAYLAPGIVGHDPWKQDETYTFGIVRHMLDTGDWVVPTNAGLPFLEKPPLYDWVAVAFVRLFGGILPLHDAARLASGLFAALAFGYVARAARVATGAARWFDPRVIGPVALCAGTLVVIKHTHDMMTDVALMAGTAIGFCGLLELVAALLRVGSPDYRAAVRLGAGVGIALMSKGLFVPLVFGATAGIAFMLYPACRTRGWVRALVVAVSVCAPFMLIWPTALYLRSETLFATWFWDNNVGRFFGFSVPMLGAENDKPLFIWRALLTVGFPVGPLALAAIAGGILRGWRNPAIALPIAFAAIGLVVLHVAATSRQLYILPFIGPLSLIAACSVERMHARLHAAWDCASRCLFGAFAMLVWCVWFAMTGDTLPRNIVAWLGAWLPLDWTIPLQPAAICAALVLSAAWVAGLPLLRHTGAWRGVLSWASGAVLAWGLVYTLLLPWIDVAKSYRSVFDGLKVRLASEWRERDCIASPGLGESEAPMLDYFAGIRYVPLHEPRARACRWLILQGVRGAVPDPGARWVPFWYGARPGDTHEALVVYRVVDGESSGVDSAQNAANSSEGR
ncbi:ArnT family glycosyltransferase [Burkholderia pseudomultivorans]|uniref:Undecaprenyl phosphate-alpha-4-amino-4-deoxy-L-arabinose arabinosyl transferase n=1 Tax=Burkholderia pseudomultivorans TaxID=1207504 RepID=A0ABU2E881_9BURK|nr:glycosyl transferase [Burkholderia pseudomultivorans]MDR8727171.1 Undecaprenyl phosphate-alpha-4-amino-4-deoxy-L-arabinose arabinosyl transferase [Burkholderia pseudomultivorans]MDR8732990.1 Undecaprenyl phosphate-alpha-4-amino-4-deoxy-L-arabinose arabinosyl transferase [Burkholderia pseudomultivorans]MDR8739856.1 Undecaprenyl phosphate-alpha-4-amino-4-deoxy-L-arabinose arabinosyl transferase [Burkholderia pseudomultivorans]MDR8756062.1 Undecaprenyl phosphate-alpha-4-amino-4-deoxy-L-arabinos